MVATGRLPKILTPGNWAPLNQTVGEDTVANAPLGKSATTRLRVRVSSVGSGEDITVRLNGQLPSIAVLDDPPAPDPLGIWLGMDVDPAVVRAGDNLVKRRFDSSRGMDEPPACTGLQLVRRYC